MSIVDPQPYEPMVGDPDDHRPKSEWRLVTDPGGPEGRVDTLALVFERIAPGDQIPLHRHRCDEVVVVLEGDAEVRLGGERRRVEPGTAVFIPAGTPHGTRNAGDVPVHIHAAFPTLLVEMDMLERIPAPGTENDPPRRTQYDLRTGEATVL